MIIPAIIVAMKARYWRRIENGGIVCALCPNRCSLAEGENGKCQVRGVRQGELKALSYGQISSAHLDPMEKKPLYHFYPGSQIFSIGGWGCNFTCSFCQNWQISQRFSYGVARSPESVVKAALEAGSIGIAYTYNEPLIAIEFLEDTCTLARERGLKNVLVTNGYVLPEACSGLLKTVDAVNVDIKSMEDVFYKKHCGGRLKPVLDFCVQAHGADCHIEITNLIIPGENDRPELFESLSVWIASKIGRNTPLHLSAYFPNYKMNVRSTKLEILERAREICLRHLDYVYLGNVH